MQETCARLQSRSNTPQAGPGIMSRWTEDCISCPHLCYQLQHITSLDDTLLSLFLKKRKKKKKKEEDLKTNTITWIHQWSEVTAKTATKIYQNLCVCVLSHFSCVWLYVTLWTVALQVPLSMGLENGQEYWSGLPCSPSGDLLDPTSVSWISCIAAGSWPLETDKSRVIVRICFPGTEAPRPLWGPGTLKGPFDELPVVYLDSMEENYSGGGGGA